MSKGTVVQWHPLQVSGQGNEPASKSTGSVRRTPPSDQRLYDHLSIWAILRTVDQEFGGLGVVESMAMEA